MPRTSTRAEPAPVAFMASAVRYSGSTARIYQGYRDWQQESWRMYDIIGELRFAANWVGNVLSRATLKAAKRDRTGEISDTPSQGAINALAALFAGSEGQAAMLTALGLHLTVAGEAYVVGRTVVTDTGQSMERWEVVGVREMRANGNNWSIDYGSGQAPIQLTDDDVVIRIWRPHPTRHLEADSPVRSALPILSELEYLTRHVFAQITSRLAGAGLLVLPQGMSFPVSPDMPQGSNSADAFMAVLGEAMLTPIKDPDNPSALVPIVVTVPDDLVDKANLIHFWTDLDQHAIEMRNEAIRRFALAMDMPPEIVLGIANTGSAANHWTSWQIEESSIKVHVEPMLTLVTEALTDGYLIPATNDITDCIAFDTSAIRLRPDRSKEAFELYDRGVIDAEALRRENGFDEDDAPDDTEYKDWLLRKVASGSANPDQVAAAFGQLGVLVPGESGPTRESRPAPTLRGHPQRALPERAAPNVAALVAAADVLVFRALERAGNRIRARTGQKPPCSAAHTYLSTDTNGLTSAYLLTDAWTCVPDIAANLGADPIRLTANLDTYCRYLLDNKVPHDPARLTECLMVAAPT